MKISAVFLTLALAIIPSVAFTAEESDLLVQVNEQLPQAESSDLILNYNSKVLDPSLLDGYSKTELIQMIRSHSINPIEKKQKLTDVQIPLGPNVNWDILNQPEESIAAEIPDEKTRFEFFKILKNYREEFSKDSVQGIIDGLEQLSEQDLRLFLSKKHAFLTSIANGLEAAAKKVRVPPPYKVIQGLVNSMNTLFYQKIQQFVHSNTFGVPGFVTVGVGSTFGRLIYDFVISNSRAKDYINRDSGFYLASSVGIGISRVRENNQSAWMLDVFVDIENLKRSFAPIFEAYSSVGVAPLFETRQMPQGAKNFFDNRVYRTQNHYSSAVYAPGVGSLLSGPGGLSNRRSLGASLPIPLPSTFYENNLERHYMHVVLKRPAVAGGQGVIKSLISKVSQSIKYHGSKAKICKSFY